MSRLCTASIAERVDTSGATLVRGKGALPWTANQAGVQSGTGLLLAVLISLMPRPLEAIHRAPTVEWCVSVMMIPGCRVIGVPPFRKKRLADGSEKWVPKTDLPKVVFRPRLPQQQGPPLPLPQTVPELLFCAGAQ
jgi:hypothetical protein